MLQSTDKRYIDTSWDNVWTHIQHLFSHQHGQLVQKHMTTFFIAIGECYGDLLSNTYNKEKQFIPWQQLHESLSEIHKCDLVMREPNKSVYIAFHYLFESRNANFDIIHSFLELVNTDDNHINQRRLIIESGVLNKFDKSIVNKILSFLLRMQFNVDAAPEYVKVPAIMKAAEYGNARLVDLLRHYGASIYASHNHNTALSWAMKHQQYHIVYIEWKRLQGGIEKIESHALERQDHQSAFTHLMFALSYTPPKMCMSRINVGDPLNVKRRFAALLQHHARYLPHDPFTNTALPHLQWLHSDETSTYDDWLRINGLNTTGTNDKGQTATIVAAIEGDVVNFKKAAVGVDIDTTDFDGKSALMYAVIHQRIEIVRQLINRHANQVIVDHDDHDVIYYAHQQYNQDTNNDTSEILHELILS